MCVVGNGNLCHCPLKFSGLLCYFEFFFILFKWSCIISHLIFDFYPVCFGGLWLAFQVSDLNSIRELGFL